MKPSESIKPISYVKAHASELIRDISKNRKTLVITQNGEAKAILQDIKVFEQTQESLVLLKMLAISGKSMREGKLKPVKRAFRDVKRKIDESRKG
jgi:PHD/YefM family antitoxin component YafN of YafNO toxin-antitoxin module